MLKNRYIALLLLALLLTGCTRYEMRERLGLIREAPDELSVVTYAPLTIPDNFDLIRPTEKTIDEEPSNGEILLLEKTKSINVNK